MKGLIAAAGLCTRRQDIDEHRNKALLDLGGDTFLDNIQGVFARAMCEAFVIAGLDAAGQLLPAPDVCLLNPFYKHYGMLDSIRVI